MLLSCCTRQDLFLRRGIRFYIFSHISFVSITNQHLVPMRFVFMFLVVIVGLTACKEPELSIQSFWDCHHSQRLDSSAISGRLVGSWVWSQQSCFLTRKTTKADKSIKVVFHIDQRFQVFENTTEITTGTWQLKASDSGTWELDLSSTNRYLNGRILICDNQVVFNNSYIDGCDNAFVRIE